MLHQNLLLTRCLNIFNNSRILYNNRISSTNFYQQINGIHLTIIPKATTTTISAINEKFKELKIPEKPKKPLTAYFKYVQERRPELLKEQPNLKTTELIRRCAEEWRNMHPTNKEKYEEQYRKDMEEFARKFLKYNSQLTDEQKRIIDELKWEKKRTKQKRELRKMQRAANKPKRPISAYTCYLMDQAKKLNKSYNELIQEFKGKWSNLPETERLIYIKQAEKDKERYVKEMALWEQRMIEEGNEDLVSLKTRKTINTAKHGNKE